jgi:hypothetical protein
MVTDMKFILFSHFPFVRHSLGIKPPNTHTKRKKKAKTWFTSNWVPTINNHYYFPVNSSGHFFFEHWLFVGLMVLKPLDIIAPREM